MPANLHCPYRNICKGFPNCEIDYKRCRLFLLCEAERDMKPVKWRPDVRK